MFLQLTGPGGQWEWRVERWNVFCIWWYNPEFSWVSSEYYSTPWPIFPIDSQIPRQYESKMDIVLYLKLAFANERSYFRKNNSVCKGESVHRFFLIPTLKWICGYMQHSKDMSLHKELGATGYELEILKTSKWRIHFLLLWWYWYYFILFRIYIISLCCMTSVAHHYL
jgi:hypothetical protein